MKTNQTKKPQPKQKNNPTPPPYPCQKSTPNTLKQWHRIDGESFPLYFYQEICDVQLNFIHSKLLKNKMT